MTDRPTVTLPDHSPAERALATLRRQLIIDAILAVVGTLALVPLDGPIPWRVVALGGATLLTKSLATTVVKYDRAREEDADD